MIRVQTDPIDYLCEVHGHPSTWKIEGATIVKATIEERKVSLVVDIPPCGDKVLVITSQADVPFWEVVISASNKSTRRQICLAEKV